MALSWIRARASYLAGSVADAVYPETCAGCQTQAHLVSWCARGPQVRGLRACDRPHLCRRCWLELQDTALVCQERKSGEESTLELVGAGPTTGQLVKVVGTWKYHGVRGLAWPLGELLSSALFRLRERGTDLGTLVPVPLHRRRLRSRGFNQAALLAELAARPLQIPVAGDLARRVRDTGQQAKLEGPAARWSNLAGCFSAVSPETGNSRRLTLVDDLVTSGATTGKLAQALRRAGWQVDLVVALGLARDGTDP